MNKKQGMMKRLAPEGGPLLFLHALGYRDSVHFESDTVGDGLQLLNKTLPQLLQEIQDKLYELDEEIISFMDDQPEFQEEYFIAGRVTDRRATHPGKEISNE